MMERATTFMLKFFRSKYLWGSIGLLLLIVLSVYLAWTVSKLDQAATVLPTESRPTQNTSPEKNTNTSNSPAEPATNTSETPSTNTTTSDNADFGACNVDAETYCSGFYSGDWQTWAAANGFTTASWKLGLVDCLGQNRDQTSEACDASLDRRQVLNDNLNNACATDRGTYCAGVVPKPGSEPQVDCLKANYNNLSAECAAAVDAHEAAKPTAE